MGITADDINHMDNPFGLEDSVEFFMGRADQLVEIGFPPFFSELRQNRWKMFVGPDGESTEYLKAEAHDDLPEVVDGLIDMMWVLMGTLYTYVGPQCARALMAEVRRANLSKVDGSLGELVKDDNGKVRKPEGWTGPDVRGVLERFGWQMNENGVPVRD